MRETPEHVRICVYTFVSTNPLRTLYIIYQIGIALQYIYTSPVIASITSTKIFYSGTSAATLFQKSHLTPLPPSHVYAFTSSKLFRKPGSPNSVMFPCPFTGLVIESAVPPVWFRFAIYGSYRVKGGQFSSGLEDAVELVVELDTEAPAAIDEEIDGFDVLMKFPHIR